MLQELFMSSDGDPNKVVAFIVGAIFVVLFVGLKNESKLILTGLPGIGKTSLLRRLLLLTSISPSLTSSL